MVVLLGVALVACGALARRYPIAPAILLAAEVESALGRLAHAGLVRVLDDWTFELTDEGLEVWSEGTGHDLLGRVVALQEQLSAFEPGTARVRLPQGAMERAVEDYLGTPGRE